MGQKASAPKILPIFADWGGSTTKSKMKISNWSNRPEIRKLNHHRFGLGRIFCIFMLKYEVIHCWLYFLWSMDLSIYKYLIMMTDALGLVAYLIRSSVYVTGCGLDWISNTLKPSSESRQGRRGVMYLDSFAVEFLDTEEKPRVSKIKKILSAALLLLIIIVYLHKLLVARS